MIHNNTLRWTSPSGRRFTFRMGDDGKVVTEVDQDVKPLLDWNGREAAHGRHKTAWGHKVGSIPLNIVDDWWRMGLRWNDPDDAKKIRRKIETDIDYRKLRTY